MVLASPLPVPLTTAVPMKRQLLDGRETGERTGDGRGDRIDAAGVVHGIRAVLQHIDVIAQPAGEGVLAETAGQRVVAAIAVEQVVAAIAIYAIDAVVAVDALGKFVARQVDRGRSGKRGRGKRLDVLAGGKRIGSAGQHRVVALPARFERLVACIVDIESVVARSAGHLVGSPLAPQAVVAGRPVQHIGEAGADILFVGVCPQPVGGALPGIHDAGKCIRTDCLVKFVRIPRHQHATVQQLGRLDPRDGARREIGHDELAADFRAVHGKELAENVEAAIEAAVVPHDQEVSGLQADHDGYGARVNMWRRVDLELAAAIDRPIDLVDAQGDEFGPDGHEVVAGRICDVRIVVELAKVAAVDTKLADTREEASDAVVAVGLLRLAETVFPDHGEL